VGKLKNFFWILTNNKMIDSIKITDELIILNANENAIELTAYAECCSTSYILLRKNFDDNDYIGKKYKNTEMVEMEIDENYVNEHYNNNSEEDSSYVEFKEYRINFTDSTCWNILLKNSSNGYYTGWIDIDDSKYLYGFKELKDNHDVISETKLIIVVGLPASGKTTYCKCYHQEYELHDDFIKNIHDDNLMNKLRTNMNDKIIINDPRLCDEHIFIKYVKLFMQYIKLANITFVLFENNSHVCIQNSVNRNTTKDLNLKNTILNYSDIYNVNDTSKFIDYIHKELELNNYKKIKYMEINRKLPNIKKVFQNLNP
jgi:adenylate kinase family enzyme